MQRPSVRQRLPGGPTLSAISTFLVRAGGWLGVAVWARLRGRPRLLTPGEGPESRGKDSAQRRLARGHAVIASAPGRGATLRSTNGSEKALELCSHHTHLCQGLPPNSWRAAAGLTGSGESGGRGEAGLWGASQEPRLSGFPPEAAPRGSSRAERWGPGTRKAGDLEAPARVKAVHPQSSSKQLSPSSLPANPY